MAKRYIVPDHNLGLPGKLPKIIDYSDMTVQGGGSNVPTFKSPPTVLPVNCVHKTSAGVVTGTAELIVRNITTTGFTVDKDQHISKPPNNMYGNFIIVGTPTTVITEYTAAEMESDFRFYIADTGTNQKFSRDRISREFNMAQDWLMRVLRRQTFRELDNIQLAIDLDSSGTFDLNGLNNNIYKMDKGLDDLRITSSSDIGPFPDLIRWKEWRELVRKDGNYADEDQPVAIIRGSEITIEPFDSGTQVDILFMEQPDTIVLKKNGVGNVNCVFDREKCMCIVGKSLQTYMLKSKFSLNAFGRAVDTIDEINKRVRKSDSIRFPRLRGGTPIADQRVMGGYGQWNWLTNRNG